MEYVNTWVDGIYAAFTDADAAVACALALQKTASAARDSRFPIDIGLRLAAHFGPVFPVTDPITKRSTFLGTNVTTR